MFNSEFSFRGILFDMDGLLIDSERLSYESFCSTASTYDVSVTMEDYRQMIGLNHVTGLGILADILPDSIDPAVFKDDWLLAYRALFKDDVPLKDGAYPLLAHLHEIDMPVAVATSSSGSRARTTLEKVGLWQFIQHLTGGDEVANGKPAPDVYLDAATKLGINPQDCVAFEDSENGTNAAIAAGIRVIQVPDLAPAMRPANPPHHQIASNLLAGAALIGIKLA
jgi:HAD superfamily hydrolase (TIGR01509 family)